MEYAIVIKKAHYDFISAITDTSLCMSTLKVSLEICSKLDALCQRFWWRVTDEKDHYSSPKSWDFLCHPKDHSGLSFKRTKSCTYVEVSIEVETVSETIWVQCVKAKYLKISNFVNNQFSHGSWA